MSSLTNLPKDILRLIIPLLSLSDIGSMTRTCRAWRSLLLLVTSVRISNHLLAERDNPVEIFRPTNRCQGLENKCSYSGTETNYGLCSSCVRGHPQGEELIRTRTAWLKQKVCEDERFDKTNREHKEWDKRNKARFESQGKSFREAIVKMPQLRQLIISHLTKPNYYSIPEISMPLAPIELSILPNLKCICINGLVVAPDAAMRSEWDKTTAVMWLPNLVNLEFLTLGLSLEDATIFASAVAPLTRLSLLSLPNARAHEAAPLLQALPPKLRSLELGRTDFKTTNELEALVQFTCLVRLIIGVHYSVRWEEARERLARLTTLRYVSLNCHFDEDQVKAVLPELVLCSVSPRETWKDNAHLMVQMDAGVEMPCCPYVPPKAPPQKEKIHRYTNED